MSESLRVCGSLSGNECNNDKHGKNFHFALLQYLRAYFSLASSQWETSLQSNAVSHWLGANLGSVLISYMPLGWRNRGVFDNASPMSVKLQNHIHTLAPNILLCCISDAKRMKWIMRQGYEVAGLDIIQHANVPLEKCKELCMANQPSCRSIDYNRVSRMCHQNSIGWGDIGVYRLNGNGAVDFYMFCELGKNILSIFWIFIVTSHER